MTKSRTVRRDMLLRRLKAGRLLAKCNYSLTDDYAFDNAIGFGKTPWLKARHPEWIVDDEETERGHYDFIEGQMNLKSYHFEGKCGGAYRSSDVPERVHLYVHSNLSYDLYVIPEGQTADEALELLTSETVEAS